MRFEEVKLQDVADYVKERMPINEVLTETYVSTENLLPNKSGKTIASAIPNAKTVIKYQKKDVLISNIRPYFKKIWFSDTEGGASSDVLVIRSNEKVEASYLYYFLSQDKIFDYMVQTSKGTKMPRGDKDALMKYPVFIPDLNEQRKVSYLLSNIDHKININNITISNLEQLAQTLFKHWFVDFEFPNEEGKPYKSSGGKMVESELGMIPKGWEVGTFGDVINISSGKRPKVKVDCEDEENAIPIIGASKIMGYTNSILFDESIVVIGRVGTHGVVQRYINPCWPSDNTFVLKSKYEEFMYQQLKTIDYNSLNRGSTQPLITQKDIKNLKIVVPAVDILLKFEKEQIRFKNLIFRLNEEKSTLSNLRDTLLPKLLSGEIELPDDLEVGEDV